MDDERWEPGMPVLDRQAVPEAALPAGPAAIPSTRGSARPVPGPLPASLAGLPPRSVPETRPTALQQQYVLLSVPGLIAGFIAISGLELGLPLGALLIKLCVHRRCAAPCRGERRRDPAHLAGRLGVDAG